MRHNIFGPENQNNHPAHSPTTHTHTYTYFDIQIFCKPGKLNSMWDRMFWKRFFSVIYCGFVEQHVNELVWSIWVCTVRLSIFFHDFYCFFFFFYLEMSMIFHNQNSRIHIMYIYIILPPSNSNKYWGLSILHLTTNVFCHNRFLYFELFYLHDILLERRRFIR